MAKPEAAAVKHNKLWSSEIYCLYEKIQQFDYKIKHKKQTKHTNAKVSQMSSVTQREGHKAHTYFIALTVREGRG